MSHSQFHCIEAFTGDMHGDGDGPEKAKKTGNRQLAAKRRFQHTPSTDERHCWPPEGPPPVSGVPWEGRADV